MYEKLDSKLINKAYLFALERHKGQKYGDQEFIYHPEQVYALISLLSPKDTNLKAAALLHDTIEDTDTTKAEIEKEFNRDVAQLVWEVTKYIPAKGKKATFPNLKTKRGIQLKFADRLANLSNLQDWPDKKVQWYLESSRFWQS